VLPDEKARLLIQSIPCLLLRARAVEMEGRGEKDDSFECPSRNRSARWFWSAHTTEVRFHGVIQAICPSVAGLIAKRCLTVAHGTRKSCKFGLAASPLLHSPNPPWHLANSSAAQRDHPFRSPHPTTDQPIRCLTPVFHHPHICNTRSQAGYWMIFDHHPRFGRRCGGCGNDASERSHTSPFTRGTRPSSR
jgi:hypothetical protein